MHAIKKSASALFSLRHSIRRLRWTRKLSQKNLYFLSKK
jgi:ribosomal protein L24E